MPGNFYYAPGIQDRSGELMALGIAGAGRALGEGLGQMSINYAQQKKDDAAAKALYNAMMPEAGQDGATAAHPIMPKEKFELLSAQDRIAATAGYVKNTVLQQAMAEHKQQQQMRKLQIEDAVAQQGAEGALPGALKTFFAPDQRQVTPNMMAGAAAGAGPVSAGRAKVLESAMADGNVNPPLTGDDRMSRLTPEMLNSVNRTPAGRMILEGAMREMEQNNKRTPLENALVFDKTSLPGNTVVKTRTGAGFQVVPNERPNRTKMTDFEKQKVINDLWSIHDAAAGRIAGFKSKVDKPDSGDDTDYASLLAASQEQQSRALAQLQEFGAIKPSAKAAPAAGGTGGPVTTKAQFDALPSGTVYTGKDGKQYRKP
jgi:hypothetical protein